MSDSLLQNAQSAHQAGQIAEAARLYHDLLRGNPRHFEALYALGMIYFQGHQFDRAQYLIGEALKLDPLFLDGLCVRGVVLVKLKRYQEAIACFERALAMKPDFVDALSNLGTALLEMGRREEGLVELDRALAIDPTHAVSWNNRGNVLVAMKRHEEALESYDRALAILPEFPDAQQNRLYALGELNRGGPRFAEILCAQGEGFLWRQQWKEALECYEEALAIRPDLPGAAENRERAYREMHRALFDGHAPYFEESLLKVLNYRGHIALRELAERVWPGAKMGVRILDLGCGTGLGGDQFKDWTLRGRLDGVDFSAGMLELARKRGIYTNLMQADLDEVLTQPGESYDLIIASDTLVYLGDLETLFARSHRRLQVGGFFLFTVERKDGEGWQQTPKRRIRHSEAYLRRAAGSAGLIFADMMDCVIRLEDGAPVAGFAVALRK
jgi:predicted TPR repeat methyltransferase/Flp pilus assembly protein TadD